MTGVRVPAVRQVIKTADGSALLAMDRVNGSSLDRIPEQGISDPMLQELWKQVEGLHRARIAHRSLRAANIVVDHAGGPWIVDFSFSELGATQRQMALDTAELLASLASIVGDGRAADSAAAAIGPDGVGAAVPLLQPLALSADPRRAVAPHDGLLAKTRAAAAAASGREDQELARIQRIRRPSTLLAIAAAAGAFYYLLPQLAHVPSSWHAVLSADWAWMPLIIALSALTYLASAVALMGGAATDPVLADCAGPGCLIVCQPRLPGQRRRDGPQCPVSAEIRGGTSAAVGVNSLVASSCTWS